MTHSKSQPVTDKATKTKYYYTVGYVPQNGKTNPSLAINLKGRWLEQIGFFSGQAITVTIEEGRMIIEHEMRF